MKILSVIPIVKGVAPDVLTYYTRVAVRPGALVQVSMRGKAVPALVTRVDEASTNKADIKRALFSLKKIDTVIAEQCFDEAFLQAVERIATHHAAPVGTTLASLVPKTILENCAELISPYIRERQRTSSETRLIHGAYAERVARYRAFVREAFASTTSICVVAPTLAEAETLYHHLAHGIEDRSFLITPALPKKKLIETWQRALEMQVPICVVGTGSSLALPRHDVGVFIIEHEASPHYKTQTRPFVDTRTAVAELAVSCGAIVICGDVFARVGSIDAAIERGDETIRPSLRQERTKPIAIVDMSTVPDSGEKKPSMSPESLALLTATASKGERSFVYSLRKGYSGFTVCRDCGKALVCDRCDAPMVLHSVQKNHGDAPERKFECHRCGRVRDTNTVCDVCGSWRLEMYGVGVEKVADILATTIPDVPRFVMSSDTIATHAQARKLINEWHASTNGILIGTDGALPYLRGDTVGASVVASVDTVLALPDIGMQERVFRLMSELADMSESLIIQTRSPNTTAFVLAAAGTGWDFYQSEIAQRKALSYPPYSILIKVTRRGDEATVMRDLGMIHEMCLPYSTIVYPAFIARVKDLFVAHALISVPRTVWPDERLVTQLRGLPPTFLVNVAPESIL